MAWLSLLGRQKLTVAPKQAGENLCVLKVVLIAAAAVIVCGGSAHAITVKKKRDAPGEPTAVWAS
jgi:hypothetical protein